ncbi:MAG: hypothetical protein OK474_08680 [Thaumarchaeota archaeon]|nr:hypothetical protein [Nitrososphaerota archaeon]
MSGASQTSLLVRIFLLTWLWSIFAGFYLAAYTFWVPTLFTNLLIVIPLVTVTLILGFGLLYDGFGTALTLGGGSPGRALPAKRLWRLTGGLFLLAYFSVYLPASGRVVAHWPLDLAITVLAGLVMVAYAIMDR